MAQIQLENFNESFSSTSTGRSLLSTITATEGAAGSSSTDVVRSTPSLGLMMLHEELKREHLECRKERANFQYRQSLSTPPSPPWAPSAVASPRRERLVCPDGKIFVGTHIDGVPLKGRMYYEDGTVYRGGFVDGKRHGLGRASFPDGSVYKGEFLEGAMHGKGTMVWSDGGYYVGEWYMNEIRGRGIEVRADGSVRHDGIWKDGIPLRKHSDKEASSKGSDEHDLASELEGLTISFAVNE